MAPRAGSKRKPPDPQAENGRPVDDNQPKILASEDREALFTKHLVQARADNAEVEKALEVVRGLRKKRNRNRNLCSTDGFPLKHLDEILADEGRDRVEIEQDAEKRTFMRVAANQPVIGAAQLDLFGHLATPSAQTEEKGETHYRSLGYAAGFTGQPCDVPESVPPGEPAQWWVAGWGDGQGVLGDRLGRAKEIVSG